ncbi:MAG: hypothetical protein RLZZ420_1758 [Bacteroidota bacterium]|jgi:hypothetical protein
MKTIFEWIFWIGIAIDFFYIFYLCYPSFNGYRVIIEKNACDAQTANATVGEDVKRKLRIAAGAFQCMNP